MSEKGKRKYKGLKITAGVLVGLWVVIILALQVVLNSKFLEKTAARYAPQFIDGDVKFSRIKASMFRSFPNLRVDVYDFSLTYPHERWAGYDASGIRDYLDKEGRCFLPGEGQQDTLASFDRLSVSVNWMKAVFMRFKITNAEVSGARLFAHMYDSTAANWNMFGSKEAETQEDTAASKMPTIILGRVALTDKPHIVFTDRSDTIFAALDMDRLIFDGRINLAKPLKGHDIGLRLDSLGISGRLPADTLVVDIDRLRLGEKRYIKAEMDASAQLAMKSFGRMDIPVKLRGKIRFPGESFTDFDCKNLKLDVATLSLKGKAKVTSKADSLAVKASLEVPDSPLSDLLAFFGGALSKVQTDAKLGLKASWKGGYHPKTKKITGLEASLSIPLSAIAYKGLQNTGGIEVLAKAFSDSAGRLDADAEKIALDLGGLDLNGRAKVRDLLGGNAEFGLDAKLGAELASLAAFFPKEKGISAEGSLEAALSGTILQSQFGGDLADADLQGRIRSGGLIFNDAADTISAYLGKTDISLGKAGESGELSSDKLGFKGGIDSLYAAIGEEMFLRGSGISLTAQATSSTASEEFGTEKNPVAGRVKIASLGFSGSDSLFVGLKNTNDGFRYSKRASGRSEVPIIVVDSENESIFAQAGVNRFGANDARMKLSATLYGADRGKKRKSVIDSLQRVYPGVERDSLLSRFRRERRDSVPDYLSEKDFQKKDIQIQVSESIAKYVKDWKIGGDVRIAEGLVITPYFPLKNEISDFEGTFDNDRISLKNLTLKSGGSDLSAKGELSGLRRAINNHGPLVLSLDMTSDKIDANELIAAWKSGSLFQADGSSMAEEGLSDEEYLASVAMNTAVPDSASSKLLIVPANLIANVTLRGHEVDWSTLVVNWCTADLVMKERCLQLTNTVATSNMGDLYFEGFYSTRTKKDLSAGFDLNMVDITADKVIELFPAVDSVIPMLKNFKGNLDCEMAATSQLDTNMNLVMPSIDGLMKIGGENLQIDKNDAYKKLARMLLFKDKKQGRIDKLSINGLISDNKLEIFPFILKVDRYKLALSGLQDFDQSFKYHISVLRSPIPFRFGINLTGNFDDWKIRLSKAKYKNENVPVFTKQLDTMQVNLVNSIHNIFQRGVEAALAQNTAAKNDVAQAKDKAGYTDELPEPLDSARQVMLDSLLYAFDHPEDSTLSARLDSLTSSADSIFHDDAASMTDGAAPVIGAASAMNVSGTPAHPSGNEAADKRRQLILAPEKEDDKR